MKTLEIRFSVQGWVKQTVEVNDNVTAEQLQKMLNDGQAFTTIQEGGEVIGQERAFGTIGYINNQCKYTNFEVKEDA